MTLGKLLGMFRLLAGIGLIGVAIVLGVASTALLDMGNFRTEGSPAGAGLFVVMLVLPPAALAALIAGIVLIRSRRWLRTTAPTVTQPPVATPPARDALWRLRADGARLGALINGELAVLQYRSGRGIVSHSINSAYRGRAGATYPFVADDGSLLQLPTAWALPSALAQRALTQFERGDDPPAAVGWQPCSVSPTATRGADAWRVDD